MTQQQALQQQISTVFKEEGVMAKAIDGYRTRQQQVEMAQVIARAIEDNQLLVAEAGTGTGKTFAYLVPALLSGGKVIVSTGTKNLQDQLFYRDIPSVREALTIPVTVSMLKGRANYVCHYHLKRAAQDGRFGSREDAAHVQAIQTFAEHSRTGDKAELSKVPEDSPVWSQVTSTRENCIGADCEHYKECFVMEARKQALAADVVVVNHHLFFADVMLRDEGVAELLPSANTVIFDEAHQLPGVAGLFFGEDISTNQLLELSRDCQAAQLTLAKDCIDLAEKSVALDKAAKDFRLVFAQEGSRMPAHKAIERQGFTEAFDSLLAATQALTAVLETQAERDPLLEQYWERGQGLQGLLISWMQIDNTNLVRWVEVFSKSVQLHATPLSIAEGFSKQLQGQPRAWVFTSATLSVKNDFSHYQAQMGLLEAQTGHWESPFDFQTQGLFYVPNDMPDPNSYQYSSEVVKAAMPVIQASGGRAFILSTSIRAMHDIHDLLKEALLDEGLEYPILLQGSRSRTELLDRFRQLGNAILVGSQSFWEGVDVRGEALSVVIIDKLPFTPPDDPVLSARVEQMKREGQNAFMDYQLPHAVINLKQGAGRLIRDENDRGVLMICDPRLISKPYGRRIWQSLPPFKRTRVLTDVVQFFDDLDT